MTVIKLLLTTRRHVTVFSSAPELFSTRVSFPSRETELFLRSKSRMENKFDLGVYTIILYNVKQMPRGRRRDVPNELSVAHKRKTKFNRLNVFLDKLSLQIRRRQRRAYTKVPLTVSSKFNYDSAVESKGWRQSSSTSHTRTWSLVLVLNIINPRYPPPVPETTFNFYWTENDFSSL